MMEHNIGVNFADKLIRAKVTQRNGSIAPVFDGFNFWDWNALLGENRAAELGDDVIVGQVGNGAEYFFGVCAEIDRICLIMVVICHTTAWIILVSKNVSIWTHQYRAL